MRANQGDSIRDLRMGKRGGDGVRRGRGRGRYQKPLNGGSIWSSGIYVGCGDGGLAGDHSRGGGGGGGWEREKK